MLCANCGTTLPDGSKYCLGCGKSLQPKTGHSTKALIISIVVTALVVLAVAIAVVKWSGAKQNDAAQTSTTVETAANGSQPKPSAIQLRELTTEELFKLAAPSVVLVEVFGESGQKIGTGSGFVVDSGAVVTNYHVIRGGYSATTHFQDGGNAGVLGVLGFDPDRDVAILKVSESSTKPLPLGDSEQLQVGNHLVAIGSPKGLQNTMSDGLVSGIRNGLIQTSTPISPGSSGGPLFNTRGEVVGIAVASAADAENLNFAVPINWAKRYVHGSQLTSLSDLSRQNTVVQSLIQSTVSVPAGQRRAWPIEIDRNRMTSPELQGSFTSSGGVGGNIRVAVVDDSNQVMYDSGRTNSGNVHLQLKPGKYALVIDNAGSMMFARSVTADFELKYVK